jgi:hypothetical protein
LLLNGRAGRGNNDDIASFIARLDQVRRTLKQFQSSSMLRPHVPDRNGRPERVLLSSFQTEGALLEGIAARRSGIICGGDFPQASHVGLRGLPRDAAEPSAVKRGTRGDESGQNDGRA